MFIDKNSIVINNVNMGQYITEAKFGYNKLWSSDSGRNLAGSQSGTLIGIFPKIILTFKKKKKNELQTIIPILDNPRQNVTYYDPYKQQSITIATYTGDYEIVNKLIVNNSNKKNESFSCSFISVDKRSD